MKKSRQNNVIAPKNGNSENECLGWTAAPLSAPKPANACYRFRISRLSEVRSGAEVMIARSRHALPVVGRSHARLEAAELEWRRLVDTDQIDVRLGRNLAFQSGGPIDGVNQQTSDAGIGKVL